MGSRLGYHFDKVDLRKSVYFPKAHENEEIYQRLVRSWLLQVMQEKKAIPMRFVPQDQTDRTGKSEVENKENAQLPT